VTAYIKIHYIPHFDNLELHQAIHTWTLMTPQKTVCDQIHGIIGKCVKNNQDSSSIWDQLSECIISCIDMYYVLKHISKYNAQQ